MFEKIFKKNKINKVIFNENKELFDLYKMFKGIFSFETVVCVLYFYGNRKESPRNGETINDSH